MCQFKIICYWPWYRMDTGGPDRHTPEDIDPTLCTHIHYAFFMMDDQHNVIRDKLGHQPKVYQRFQALKKINPELKIIPSMGYSSQTPLYSKMINNPGLRKAFVSNTVKYLIDNQWDGLDIDWEYPVCWDHDCTKGPKSDKPNLGKLLLELRDAFDKQTPKLSLSMAVAPGIPNGIFDQAYDFGSMNKALDYITVMVYDLAGDWDGKTGHHSRYDKCLKWTQTYADRDIDKNKLVMGVPAYGRVFQLLDPSRHSMGAPITGMGHTPHGDIDGTASYREMCDLVKNHGWTKETPDQGPIVYHNLTWVSYDDPYAVYNKSKWIKDNKYGGVMVWEITQDDWRAQCCSVKYPILKASNYGLFGTGGGPETYDCEHK